MPKREIDVFCEECGKRFAFDKKSVRFYYFYKTCYFCSKECYYKYVKNNYHSYRQWTKRYNSLTKKQQAKYHQNLKKVKKQIENLRQKYKDENKALHAQHDLIWTNPPKPAHWFEHVSKYDSFADFKKAVIEFLTKTSLTDIYKDSWNFFCHNDYKKELQSRQTRAINKVFDEIYRKGKVEWGFMPYDKTQTVNKEVIWGPYILINDMAYLLCFPYRYSLDTFIRGRLRNEK